MVFDADRAMVSATLIAASLGFRFIPAHMRHTLTQRKELPVQPHKS